MYFCYCITRTAFINEFKILLNMMTITLQPLQMLHIVHNTLNTRGFICNEHAFNNIFLSVCLIKCTSIVRTYVLYFSTSKTTITNYHIFFGVLDLVVVFGVLRLMLVYLLPLELVLYLFLCTSG